MASDALNRVRVVILFCSVVLSTPAIGSDLVERVLTFTPDGKTCVDCDNGKQEKKLAEVVAHRQNLNIAKWLFETMSASDQRFEARFQRSGEIAAYEALFGLLEVPGGVLFRLGTAEIAYERAECWIPDCYKFLLSMRDRTRRWRWRRRVSWLQFPIHPLLTDRGVMILTEKGGYPSTTHLTVIEPSSGRLPADEVPPFS